MTHPVGLISAIPAEFDYFADCFEGQEPLVEAGWTFFSGAMDGVPLIAVEAGIGKVQTAMVATLLVHRFGCRALIFSGVAGGLSPDLTIGDTVIATRTFQHDYGAMVDDGLVRYQPGVPPLPDFPQTYGYEPSTGLITRAKMRLQGFQLPPISQEPLLPERQPTIHFGAIATGDQFVNSAMARDRLFAETGAFAVEMEGAAMSQVADRFGVPWLALRTLSDLAGAESHLDFNAFMSAAAGGAASLVRRLIPTIAAEALTDARQD